MKTRLIATGEFKLLVSCLFFFIGNNVNAQTAKDIIANYLDSVSYGNPKKWHQVKTFSATTKGYFNAERMNNAISLTEKGSTSYKKIFKLWPEKMKEELYSDSLYTTLTSECLFIKNKRIFKMGTMSPIESEGDNSLWFDFLPVIVENYVKAAKAVTYKGVSHLPGLTSPMHEIEIQSRDKIRRLFFNVDTNLLEALYFPEANVYWFYSDYTNVDGYLMPLTIMSISEGGIFSRTEYGSMSFNPDINLNVFEFKDIRK
jgi:hypothetical protein